MSRMALLQLARVCGAPTTLDVTCRHLCRAVTASDVNVTGTPHKAESALKRVNRLEMRVDEVSAQLQKKLRDLRSAKLAAFTSDSAPAAGNADGGNLFHSSTAGTANIALPSTQPSIPQTNTPKTSTPKTSTPQPNTPQANTPQANTLPLRGASDDDKPLRAALKTMHDVPLFNLTMPDDTEALESWVFPPVLQRLIEASGRQPSVTKVLGQTMSAESQQALKRWEERMIRKLGYQGFLKYKKELFANGHNFHHCVGSHLQFGTDISELGLEEANQGLWESVSPVLEHITNVQLVEARVKHPLLRYSGVVDCVACYRGKPVLIDWKTSNRVKSSLAQAYDDPVQLAAYVGAMQHGSCYDIQVEGALLAVCYRDGRQAHALYMSAQQCASYWREWLQRLCLYWNMQLGDLQ